MMFNRGRRIQMLRERFPAADMSEIIEMEAEFHRNALRSTLPAALMIVCPVLGVALALLVALMLGM